MFVTCFKRRGNYIQTVILLLIVDKIIFEFVFLTEGTITYIFTKEKFDWDEDDYSTFKAVANMMRAIGTLLVTPLLKIMGVSDPFITFLGFLSSALYSYFTGLSMAPWILWMAAALGSVRSMTSAVARSHNTYSLRNLAQKWQNTRKHFNFRSMASKLVEKNEIAQILALIAFVQYLIPIAGGPLITLIFNRTLECDPGIIYYSLALITTPAFIIPLYLDLLVLKDIMQQNVRPRCNRSISTLST